MKRRNRSLLVLVASALLTGPAAAQEKLTENTLRLAEGQPPPAATIDAVTWLAGQWRGEGLGGISEETWLPPAGGAMVGTYRLVRDGKPAFYEILTILEQDGSLVLRLKHFNADLTGWEEKAETVDFPLVAIGAGTVHFEGQTLRQDSDGGVTIFLAMRQKDGSHRETSFRHARVIPDHSRDVRARE